MSIPSEITLHPNLWQFDTAQKAEDMAQLLKGLGEYGMVCAANPKESVDMLDFAMNTCVLNLAAAMVTDGIPDERYELLIILKHLSIVMHQLPSIKRLLPDDSLPDASPDWFRDLGLD